jgi:hypothetical protein
MPLHRAIEETIKRRGLKLLHQLLKAPLIDPTANTQGRVFEGTRQSQVYLNVATGEILR